MNCQDVMERLDDYVDGLLPVDEARALGVHLDACPSCSNRAASLRDLVARAKALAVPIAPPERVWTAVERRLKAERTPIEKGPGRSRWARRALLAAAAVALVAGTAYVTTRVVQMRRPGSAPSAQAVKQLSARTSVGAGQAGLREERRRLLAAFEARKSRLRPSTARVVEKNLRIIDRSLADIEAALRKDPANRDLAFLLAGTYRQELDLLRQAVRLSESQWTGGDYEKS